ncbi:replication licensing factor Cdt1 [Cladochytrium tenue]|nr:replication licensing factor Cdt1 [Cladochytrium tenue]
MATAAAAARPVFRPLSSVDGITMPLPAHLQQLEQAFHGLETAAAFLLARGRPAVYPRLRRAAEAACGRTVDWAALERAAAIFTDGYRFVPCIVAAEDGSGCRVDAVAVEMTEHRPVAAAAGASAAEEGERVASAAPAAKFRPWGETLVKRRLEFHRRLRQRVKEAHNDFLLSRKMEVAPQGAQLTAWHPEFDLSLVPEVPRSFVPRGRLTQPPTTTPSSAIIAVAPVAVAAEPASVELVSSTTPPLPASEVAKDSTTHEAPAELSASENAVASGAQGCESPSTCPSTPAAPQKPLSRAAALLQRIRDKEKKAAEEAMYKPKYDAATIRRRAMISRLVQVGMGVMSVFSTRKKTVLPLQDVGEYVQTAVRSPISHDESCDHVRLLAEVCPEWCTIEATSAGPVVRIDPGVVKLPTLKARVQQLLFTPSTPAVPTHHAAPTSTAA